MEILSSTRPYLIRAMAEWMESNQLTPYILVDLHCQGVHVPQQYAQQDEVVLNISPIAVRELRLGNEEISFQTRFGGVTHHIVVPIQAVLSIYAKENNKGIYFSRDGDIQPPPPYRPSEVGAAAQRKSGAKRPTLKVVK